MRKVGTTPLPARRNAQDPKHVRACLDRLHGRPPANGNILRLSVLLLRCGRRAERPKVQVFPVHLHNMHRDPTNEYGAAWALQP